MPSHSAVVTRYLGAQRRTCVCVHPYTRRWTTKSATILCARGSNNYEVEAAAVQKILAPFTLPPFDATTCAVECGQIRHELAAAGAPIGAMDLLIAAHAKALDAVLVTHNLQHFRRVRGLKCESWR